MLLGSCAIACAVPPGLEGPHEGGREQPDLAEDPVSDALEVAVEEPGGPEGDRLLAEVRNRVRGGRVPAALRRELLESELPDHRHAARLLQAIAGEAPASVLARSGERAVELAVAELFELEPEAELEPTVMEEPKDRPPPLSSLVVGSPAWQWFAGLEVIEPEPEPEAIAVASEVELERIVGPLPLLLTERPPIPDAGPGEGPRLVILTSLALHSDPSDEAITLELVGAGAVRVGVQPLTQGRIRLFVRHAGAVPSFSSARPRAEGIEVVEVLREDRYLEIEVELAPGWGLGGVSSLDNGASVRFERSVGAG